MRSKQTINASTAKASTKKATRHRVKERTLSRDVPISRDVLLDMSEDLPVAKSISRNYSRTKTDLRSQVMAGRDAQHILSEQLHIARAGGDQYVVSDLAEQRRLCHIATILARAELITRAHTKSLSLYSGAEAAFDDATILERAKGFARIEAEQTLSADDRSFLAAAIQRFDDAKSGLLAASQ
jgi:hypothetical protein